MIRSQMLQNVTSGTAVENHRMTHKRERARKGKDVKKTGGRGNETVERCRCWSIRVVGTHASAPKTNPLAVNAD